MVKQKKKSRIGITIGHNKRKINWKVARPTRSGSIRKWRYVFCSPAITFDWSLKQRFRSWIVFYWQMIYIKLLSRYKVSP